MYSINERIKDVRLESGKSLRAFGECIGLTGAALSLIENGKRNITDIVIKSICREFGINELWLRTGKGNMHDDVLPLDENMLIISKYLDDPDGPIGRAILSFLKVYDSYPDNKKPAIVDFVEYALSAFEKGEL